MPVKIIDDVIDFSNATEQEKFEFLKDQVILQVRLIKNGCDLGEMSQEKAVLFLNKFTENEIDEFVFKCLNWYKKGFIMWIF